MPETHCVERNNLIPNTQICLLNERIIFLSEPITNNVACSIITQLLYLESQDSEKDISMYINCPGGSVSAGLAIYDTMQYIQCDVATCCVGTAASMGAFLLAAGTPGKRYALPNSEVMIHQPLGEAQGQASDVLIYANHISRTRDKLNRMLADMTKKSVRLIQKDTDRDFYMNADEACSYGLIDKVIGRKGETSC